MLINITISIIFFKQIGFIIIPIATTISSWFNSILLLVYLINKKYFSLQINFFKSFIKIALNTILISFIFSSLIKFFGDYLDYDSEYKLLTIVSLVILTFTIYILTSILTKAFKISDINLKY